MEDPQILGATLQNLVTIATWNPRFVHLCRRGFFVCKMFMSLGSVLLDMSLCTGYLVRDVSKEHSVVTVKGQLVPSSGSLGSDEPVTQHCVP
jgi:hypothetical protein